MKPVIETYGDSFFHRRKGLIWRAPILCGIIEKVFRLDPHVGARIIDIGCAIGEFVQEFERMGYAASGWEGSEAAKRYALTPLVIADIRKDIRKWAGEVMKVNTLCMCLEVAEHIEEQYVETFIDNLCFLSNTILISAASPGQQGHGHHNCQPKEYWEIKFRLRDYRRNIEKEEHFRKLLEPHKRKKGLNGYYYNTMIYEYRR